MSGGAPFSEAWALTDISIAGGPQGHVLGPLRLADSLLTNCFWSGLSLGSSARNLLADAAS